MPFHGSASCGTPSGGSCWPMATGPPATTRPLWRICTMGAQPNPYWKISIPWKCAGWFTRMSAVWTTLPCGSRSCTFERKSIGMPVLR